MVSDDEADKSDFQVTQQSQPSAASASQTDTTTPGLLKRNHTESDTINPSNNEADDTENPTKKRKGTSDIWEHFTKKGKGEDACAICKYCTQDMDAKSNDETDVMHA
ncbi:hypothetical protein PGTUg99_011223 [Puccinia graminis f. sp. tritici]|uniref:BED-type domain-containing protein n=1 Tax=Puccinia graminis f. sp. tritici TaxID=56615 RepID=A0A5B0RET6_PUCGR|nr:hypothetical protein PGTUg99_011223 [Puccinia graminis f. sp. tritici]